VHEGEVRAFGPLRGGHASVADVVRSTHDLAGLGLAENFGQADGGNGIGGEQIGQDRSGTDAGQLVRIAHQHQ